MAHHYHRRQMRQIAEAHAKACGGEASGSGAGPSSAEDSATQQNLNNSCLIDAWNPNQIVYRKVNITVQIFFYLTFFSILIGKNSHFFRWKQ